MINVAEVYQWRWSQENGQWLKNVDPTRLALASGNPVLQKEKENRDLAIFIRSKYSVKAKAC